MSSSNPATSAPADAPLTSAEDVPSELSSVRWSDQVLALADRYRRWLLLITLLLYIAGFNAQWRLEPDSALYLGIGRNLVEGHGYTFHGKDHRLAYPGVPILFAGLYKAFGTDTSLLPHLVVMWLMGLATLALIYRLFLLHAGRPTAVLITFGVAISRVFYRYTFELLTDMPFAFGVMAFFVGYEAIFYRRSGAPSVESRGASRAIWLDGVLMLVGLAVAVSTRPSMLALVLAAALSAVWSLVRGRARWGHLVVTAIVVLAVAVFYVKDPRKDAGVPGQVSTSYAEEDELFNLKFESLRHFGGRAARNLYEVLNGAVAEAAFGLAVAPGLNILLALVVLCTGIGLVRTRPLWGMWILATLIMVLVIPKPLDRYFLPTIPILVFAWWTFVRWVERRLSGPRANYAFLLLFGIGGACNIIATAGFILENRRSPFLMHYKEGRYASVYDVARMIENNTPPSGSVLDSRTTWVVVPDKFGRILTLLSRRYCIEPSRYSALDPRVQNVLVLNPMHPKNPEANDQRQPTPVWLQTRNAGLNPVPVAKVPNKNPNDRRPFTLHDAIPIEELAAHTQPASATQPTTVPSEASRP